MLKIGDKAPDFTLENQHEKKITLSSLKGKKVVLYFYPKDNTPGCTLQACNLRDNFDALTKNNIVVLGISIDSAKSHVKFSERYTLPFSILSDENKEVVNKYGVWVEKNMYGRKYMGTARNSFLINEEGKIDAIIIKASTKHHADEILTRWR